MMTKHFRVITDDSVKVRAFFFSKKLVSFFQIIFTSFLIMNMDDPECS